MKGRDRNRTRGGSADDRYEQRAYKYVALVSEKPHPLRKVPGIRRCYWDSEIGRWVQWRPDWRQY